MCEVRAMPIFLGIYYNGTKNVPWHILATSAVVYDIFPLRASAHPAGGFLSYRKAISYTTKKRPNLALVGPNVQSLFLVFRLYFWMALCPLPDLLEGSP